MRKIISVLIIFAFILNSLMPSFGMAQALSAYPVLPQPGVMVSVSPSFEPALIKGLTVHKKNPFLFDFIVDPGQSRLSKEALKSQSERMIRYFFAALTIPDKDIWVNLSPYEKDRMVPTSLGVTTMGRDLLAQDYLLKQLTASLIYPQKALGQEFWQRVYTKAREMYGTTEVPVNTFNKVWIVPQKAGVYEHGQTAFIVSGHLKVMLEEDYLALKKHTLIQSHSIASQVVSQIVLPEIEKEVNEGKNFSTLRQIFYAQVLAVWFKRNLKQALLNQVYANKGTVKGIDTNSTAINEAIYRRYLQAYKKGVFNFIQEDLNPATQETLPRKYFSGGFGDLAQLTITATQPSAEDMAQVSRDIDVVVLAARPQLAQLDAAMTHVRLLLKPRQAVVLLALIVGACSTSSQRFGRPPAPVASSIPLEDTRPDVIPQVGPKVGTVESAPLPEIAREPVEQRVQEPVVQEPAKEPVRDESVPLDKLVHVGTVFLRKGPDDKVEEWTVTHIKAPKNKRGDYTFDVVNNKERTTFEASDLQGLKNLGIQIKDHAQLSALTGATTLDAAMAADENKKGRGKSQDKRSNPPKLGNHAADFPSFIPEEELHRVLGIDGARIGTQDRAALAEAEPGGIDLSQQDAALHVTKDADGGVKVDVDPALIARVERQGISAITPVIIGIRPADVRSLFGL